MKKYIIIIKRMDKFEYHSKNHINNYFNILNIIISELEKHCSIIKKWCLIYNDIPLYYGIAGNELNTDLVNNVLHDMNIKYPEYIFTDVIHNTFTVIKKNNIIPYMFTFNSTDDMQLLEEQYNIEDRQWIELLH